MLDLIGKTLGGYRIVEQIGLGGMTTVFKAFQSSMDRYVAFKVISTHLTQDPTFVKRFRQEAKVIAKLEHLHILPVYDHGEEDGYLYLVMRFVEAGTLKDWLKDGPLPLDEARRVVNQVGSALEYAHQLGVIHRDLKPSNILIDSQGDCYLTDFGIAKMVEGTLGLTGSSMLGTPHYMAPEQSQSLEVDHRADVYAMGIVVFEMVTGQPPFDADTPFAVLMKHVSEPLPLPRSIKPDLPESVERVILKALAKDPADRYQSMRDLVAAFDQVVSATPSEARATATTTLLSPTTAIVEEEKAESTTVLSPPIPIPTWRRWITAQPPWLLAAAGLALVVLVLAGVILSRVPERVEISGGQVQVVLPTVTATPTTEEIATATATSAQLATASFTSTSTPQPTATPTPSVTSTSTPTPQPTFTPTPRSTATPTLTPTPRPTVTPIPNPMAEQARAFAEPILAAIANRPPDYEDDFSDPGSGWERGLIADPTGWEEGERGYVDGEYFVFAPPAKLRQGWDRPITCASGWLTGLRFSDIVLEIEGRFADVQDGDWLVSFQKYNEVDHAIKYLVGFGPEGQVNIFKMSGGEKLSDLAYMQGLPVRGGLETNRLQIIAAGPQITLYVNGEPALFGTDPYFDEQYTSGELSLSVCNFADTPLEARWDNLKIWDISGL